MTLGDGWLSATSAARLLDCPASAAFSKTPKPIVPSAPDNAGTLAHFALRAWLESGAWLANDPGPALQEAWNSEAERWNVDASRLPDSVMTRSRLRARGGELSGLLRAAGGIANSEVVLRDGALKLFGQVDVVVRDADRGAIVDLKTGIKGGNERVRTQLLIYAHLYRQVYGHLPISLVAFSLVSGATEIDCSQGEVDELLARVEAARKNPELAFPSPGICKFCRRRLTCEPHWAAVTQWDAPDCVEGLVDRVETATAGLTAVRLSTPGGEHWVTGLRSIPEGALRPGSRLRGVELAAGKAGVGGELRATRLTRVLIT